MEEQSQQYLFSPNQKQWFFPQEIQPDLHVEYDDNQKFNYVDHYNNIDVGQKGLQFGDYGCFDERQKLGLEKFSQNNKYFHGLRGFITLSGKEKKQRCYDNSPIEQQYGPTKFLYQNESDVVNQNIKLPIFNNKYQTSIREIEKNQILLNNDFNLKFQNFILLEQTTSLKFFNSIQTKYLKYLQKCKQERQKKPQQFYRMIFQFWISSFHEMISQIQKTTETTCLTQIKKYKQPVQKLKQTQSLIDQPKQKRQIWTQKQIDQLENLIKSNKTIDCSKITQLSVQLGRSIISVQSKIQKILKNKKQQQFQSGKVDIPIQKKISMILKVYGDGLTKDQILAKLKQQFEMGDEQKWKKSASQLLSSSKNIIKLKGKYGLLPNVPSKMQNLKTFKNKIIKCLHEFPSKKADIKQIFKKYIQLFAHKQYIDINNEEKIKVIQANIYKTLLRYQQFDKSSSKTIYKYVQIQRLSTGTKQWQLESQYLQ